MGVYSVFALATYHILVWIHEDVEVVLFRLAQNGNSVVYPRLIVFARSLMLYGLPCEDVANGVVAPTSQSRKMCVCILEREGSVNEGNVVAVEELFGDM